MNTKIILSLGATALLASSLFALSPVPSQDNGTSCQQHKQSKMKQCDGSSCQQKNMMKSHKQNKKNGIVKMFMKLDLSDAQRAEIRSIMQENRKNRVTMSSAFTDTNFDKAQFIQIAKAKKANKAERKAELISKIYNVLTKPQKKDFKTMLDMKEIMKKNQGMKKNQQMR